MAANPAQQHTVLTFADRVTYQRAIEEVYWRHRIWPKENPNPKPSLDAVMSEAQLEKKVADYLRNSQALEDYWHRPLTAEQLQAEMDRMAQHTKQPEVLRELFEVLGNDPYVIAECLARSALSGRLVTGLDATQIETKASRPKIIAAASAKYTLPTISDETGGCTDDSWTATSTTNAPVPRADHTAIWTGSEMIVWGGDWYYQGSNHYLDTGGTYTPSTDSWTATGTTNAPAGRDVHTAVWTGTEMIVWGGGGDNNSYFNTGGRYNPSTDSWITTSTTNAPAARAIHTAIWTGSEMIVWGGVGSDFVNTGGRYNPSIDSWTATSTTNAPTARGGHTAIWTGSEMIVWGGGGDNNSYFNTGGRYNPSTDTWIPTGTTNAPTARDVHTAVWTGSEMIVWGGFDGHNNVNTGGRYNSGTDSWLPTSITNAPLPRESHTATWTGNEMIVWGGFGPSYAWNTGGSYNDSTDRWIATSITNAPAARAQHTAIWTGSEMIVWGGDTGVNPIFFSTGGRYCVQPPGPMPQSAFSRKTQGAAGTFDVPLPPTGNIGVECRSGGSTNDYQMITNFMNPVTVGSASVTSGTGSVSSFSVSGSQVTVNLTGVFNVQTITVTLFNVNDGTHMGSVSVWMNVLVGDVTGNDTVNASDVALTKSQVGIPVSSSNFREDVNANGTISSTDVAIVKSDVGTSLPP
jgi:N-acetylneuraminic acid mutarotase